MTHSAVALMTIAAFGLGGCSVTAEPDRLPVLGSLIEGCLKEVSPFGSFGFGNVIEVKMPTEASATLE
jgi:hypothetical protein